MFSPQCGPLVHEASPQQLPESSQCKVPCICLTFRGHAGKMTIINIQWKGLPRNVRSGLIHEYAQIHSDAEPSHRIIGGIMNEPVFLQDHFFKQSLGHFPIRWSDHCMVQWNTSPCPLRVLHYAAGDLTADVQTPNLDGAEVLMVQLWGVVAQESQPDAAGVTQPDAVEEAVHGHK